MRLDLAALDELLVLHRGNTKEDLLQTEGQILHYLTEEADRLREVTKYESPSVQNFSGPRAEEFLRAKILRKKIDTLVKIRAEYLTARNRSLASIELVMKRIRQKNALIELLTDNKIKWAVNESFDSGTRIQSYTGTLCAGSFLLPTKGEITVSPDSLVIDSGSKGTAGAADSINPTLQDPFSMFDGREDTWFEFYSDGGTRLNLTCKFSSTQVLNALIIESEDAVVVDSVLFDGSPLIRRFTVDGLKEVCHLPARCKSVMLQMSADEVISIKSIKFLRRTFDSKAEILSKPSPLPSSYYAAEIKIRSQPPGAGKVKVSFDGGEWQEAPVQMTGAEREVQYQFSMDNENFSVSYSQPAGPSRTLLRPLSGASSPTWVSLPSKPWKGLVWAVQPRLGRRTDSVAEARLLARAGSDGALAIPLPVKITDTSKLRIYMNRILWEEVSDEASLTGGTYLISDGMIYLSADVPVGAGIRFSFEEEEVLFEQKSDGYYYTLDHVFDPDISSIRVRGLPKNVQITTMQLPFGETRIDLGVKNIGSIDLTESFNAVSSRALLSSSGDYYLDRVNGVLYLYEAVTSESVKVTYTDSDFLVAEDVELVLDDQGVPTGIKLNQIQALDVQHKVGAAPELVFDVLAGGRSARENIFSSNPRAEVLSHSSIVRGSFVVLPEVFGLSSEDEAPIEVDYIDGFSEFQGLIPMHGDKTVEIAPDSNGLVKFNLAAGKAWYSPLGITTTDSTTFATLQASEAAVVNVGDYYVDPASGRLTVKTGSSNLSADIGIRYYYRDLTLDSSNLFSVDYSNGYFYSSDPMQEGAIFSYKSARYKIAYDLARIIPVLEVSGKRVLLKTDEMSSANNLVRLFWREEVAGDDDLKSYYSPVIDAISIQFA